MATFFSIFSFLSLTLIINSELPPPIGTPIDGVGDLAQAALVGVRSSERFQTLPNIGVLKHRHLDVGLREVRLVVVDVA